MDDKQEFYSLDRIIETNAHYNIVFGQRSNGKTYAALEYCLKKYVESGYKSQFAIIRRFQLEIQGTRAQNFFSALVSNGVIEKLTGGEWTHIAYGGRQFFFAKMDNKLKKFVTMKTPCGYAFCLSDMEHDKSTSFPDVNTVVFDEFITRQYYLPDEFVLFMNVLSTIIRNRRNVKIFMMGNTVDRNCIYFKEMGLHHTYEQAQGTIETYEFGEMNGGEKLKISVEYAAALKSKVNSNVYFAFNNSSAVNMILNGAWEMAIYPHLSTDLRYERKDVLFIYFIEWGGEYLQCEVVQTGDNFFTYIHRKTTPIQDPEHDLIFSLNHNERRNYKRRLISSASMLDSRITWFFHNDKVFYQDNEVGEVVRNYIMQSQRSVSLTV